MEIIWKDIPGYKGLYQASSLGRIKSLKYRNPRILKSCIDANNRLTLGLYKDGRRYPYKTHVLIALTFLGERPKNYDVCHIDGDRHNNKLSNLSYDTRGQNMIDMYRHGGKTGRGSLKVIEVGFVRELYKSENYTQVKLSKMFNVGVTCIEDIIHRRTFEWLNDDGSIIESETKVL